MEANNKAMREALELFAHMNDDGFYDKSPVVRSIVNKARAALAKPPRQCDVGTPEEQETRYHATGELYHTLTLRNALIWAQMPYEPHEEGGAK